MVIFIIYKMPFYRYLSRFFYLLFLRTLCEVCVLSQIEQLEEITCDWSPVSLRSLGCGAVILSQSEAGMWGSDQWEGWGKQSADHISIRFYSRLNVLFLWPTAAARQPIRDQCPGHVMNTLEESETRQLVQYYPIVTITTRNMKISKIIPCWGDSVLHTNIPAIGYLLTWSLGKFHPFVQASFNW